MKFPIYALTLLLGVPLLAPVLAAPAKKPAVKPNSKTAAKPKNTRKPVFRPTPVPPPPMPTRANTPSRETTPVPTPIAEVGPKTWALLVGVSRYQNSQISSLHYPAKDATSWRDALIDPKVGGLPAKQVLLLTDGAATRDKITGAVDSFLRPNIKEGDKVIVFLAGHGVAKGAGLEAKSYFLPTDVKGLTVAALENSAVSLRALSDDLGTLNASQFMIFTDACREDPTPGRGIGRNERSDVFSRSAVIVPASGKGESATFFACSMGQRAYEDERYGHGVFTKWILDGLKEGALAQKPSGAVDMGKLSTYVTDNVGKWAKTTSASGNFEVEQTPELQTFTQLENPIVVINYKGQLRDNVLPAAPPRITVASDEGAQISINNVRVGVGEVEKEVPTEGDYTINVTKQGFTPVSRSLKARGGYDHQVIVELEPATGAQSMGAGAPNRQAVDFYNRALEAQKREQWEVAEQGFAAAIGADPRFVAAYEASYDLHVLQNRNTNALADALGLFAASPRSAQSFAFLSRAYSHYATKGSGEIAVVRLPNVKAYGAPKDAQDAAKLAMRAAKEAVELDRSSPAAQLAQGYALAALDNEGKRKEDALAAFGKAVFADPNDAANQLGLGYGIRFYASQGQGPGKGKNKNRVDSKDSKTELNRAVVTLNQALKLRPDYYEAHRELAFCYMLMENTEAALKECNLARANRGSAGDVNEIAGIEVAMGGLHQKVAESSTGEKKTANEEASQGYLEEAKETSPNGNLQAALAILNLAGVSTSLRSFLPARFLPLLDVRGAINDRVNGVINDNVPGKVRGLPGMDKFKIPKF